MKEVESDGIFQKRYDPIIEKNYEVGSEAYNAPEIWDDGIAKQELEMKEKQEHDVFDYSLDSEFRRMSTHPLYNGEKADIFSCGATLFMI